MLISVELLEKKRKLNSCIVWFQKISILPPRKGFEVTWLLLYVF